MFILLNLTACNKVELSISDGAATAIDTTPTQFIKVSGDTQTGTVAQDLTTPLKVRVSNSLGSPLAGVAITFAITSGGGSVTNALTISDINGEAESIWTLGTSTSVSQSVTATAASLAPVVFTATPEADVPAELRIVSGPSSVTKTTCSGAIVVERLDTHGNPSDVAAVTTITVTGNSSGNIYTDATCASQDNTPDIASGSSQVTLYFQDAVAEILNLNFSSGVLISDTHAITVLDGFAAGVTYATGTQPEHLKAGDFNRDGILDIATANNGSDNVGVFIGNGDGTFAAGVMYAAGNGTRSLEVADINRDGKLDIVTHNWNANTYSVLIGNGDGTFVAAVNSAIGGPALQVNLVDLSRDGILDLISTSYSGDLLKISIGNGNGTFAVATNYPSCDGPLYSTTNDFDRDGDLDVVVTCLLSDTVAYYANNGAGVFAAQVDYVSPDTPGHIQSDDFNEDGKLDLLVCNEVADLISFYQGNGDGTFQPATTVATADFPLGLKVADYNKDGKLDFSVVARTESNLKVFFGTGNGTFGTALNYAVGASSVGQEIGDFNRDGVTDIAVTNYAATAFQVFLGSDVTRTLDINSELSYSTSGAPRDLVTRDFDADGKLDIVVASADAGTDKISFHAGDGNGVFGAPMDSPTSITSVLSTNIIKIVSEDFNRDGKWDVAISSSDSRHVAVLQGNGNGSFTLSATYIVGDSPRAIKAGDIDHDGDMDLITTNYGDNTFTLLQNNGNGIFPGQSSFPAPATPVGLGIADMDRDGKLDVVIGTRTGELSFMRGDSTGNFNGPVNFAVDTAAEMIFVADLDRDGLLDVLAAHKDRGNFSLSLGTGSGNLAAPSSTNANGVTNILMHDLDIDGHLDAIAAGGVSAEVETYQNNGSQLFILSADRGASAELQGGVLADFNDDGVIDSAYVSWQTNVISVFLGVP